MSTTRPQTSWSGGVSILVFVELALDADGGRHMLFSGRGFQSLFSWNLLLMIEEISQYVEGWEVSILVFVELALDV